MIKQTAPVAIFTYKRLDSLQRTISALKENLLSDKTDVYIFSDGYRNDSDKADVYAVRNYLNTISGFKSIKRIFSDTNQGLANSIIKGVSSVFEVYDRIIVLEDDLVTSANFLTFMNLALEFYNGHSDVFSISGYTFPVKSPQNYNYDVYFAPRASSWGWGSWKDKWQGIDWDVKDYDSFKNDSSQIAAFNRGGTDLADMLKRKMEGKIDSWAIRWCYHQFKHGLYTAYPTISKVQNIGFTNYATNSFVYNRYYTQLDKGKKANFLFSDNVTLNHVFYKKFHDFYSLKRRFIGRIYTFLFKTGLIRNKV